MRWFRPAWATDEVPGISKLVDPDLGPNALLVGKAGKPVGPTLRRGGADRRAARLPAHPGHESGGPIVALTNEYAMSGGDIVIQALKSYGIARPW